MTRTWIATALNFFLPGSGYLVLGQKRVLSLFWLAGALGLTAVELNLQSDDSDLYWPMFAAVFVMNIAFAADAHLTGRRLAAESTAA